MVLDSGSLEKHQSETSLTRLSTYVMNGVSLDYELEAIVHTRTEGSKLEAGGRIEPFDWHF